jgi:hypothetical protein
MTSTRLSSSTEVGGCETFGINHVSNLNYITDWLRVLPAIRDEYVLARATKRRNQVERDAARSLLSGTR